MNDINKAIIDSFLLIIEIREMFVEMESSLRVSKKFNKVTSTVMLYRYGFKEDPHAASIDAGLNTYLGEEKDEMYACLSTSIYPEKDRWCFEQEITDFHDEPLSNLDNLSFSDLQSHKKDILKTIEKSLWIYKNILDKMVKKLKQKE